MEWYGLPRLEGGGILRSAAISTMTAGWRESNTATAMGAPSTIQPRARNWATKNRPAMRAAERLDTNAYARLTLPASRANDKRVITSASLGVGSPLLLVVRVVLVDGGEGSEYRGRIVRVEPALFPYYPT